MEEKIVLEVKNDNTVNASVSNEEKKQTNLLQSNLLKLGSVAGGIALLNKSSQLMAVNTKLMEKSMFLFLRPLGNTIGSILLPYTKTLISIASKIATTFPTEQTQQNQVDSVVKSLDEVAGDNEELKQSIADFKKDYSAQLQNWNNITDELSKDKSGLFGQYKPSNSVQYYTGRVKDEMTADMVLDAMGLGGLFDGLSVSEMLKKIGIRDSSDITSYYNDTSYSKGVESGDITELSNYQQELANSIYEKFFKSLDVDNSADKEVGEKLQATLTEYFSTVLGDTELAKQIVQSAFNQYIYNTFDGVDKKKQIQTFADGIQKMGLAYLGTIPEDTTPFSDTLNKMQDLTATSTASALESAGNQTISDAKSQMSSDLKKLEKYSFSLPDGGSYNPFKGISGIVTALNPLNILSGIKSLLKIDDGIVTSDGKVIKTNPQDDIFAVKNGYSNGGMRGTTISTMNVNVSVEKVDSEARIRELAEKLGAEFQRQISYMTGGNSV